MAGPAPMAVNPAYRIMFPSTSKLSPARAGPELFASRAPLQSNHPRWAPTSRTAPRSPLPVAGNPARSNSPVKIRHLAANGGCGLRRHLGR
jgi:hypothetical protein